MDRDGGFVLVLTGGTAWAVNGPLAGKNTVGSEDIINNEVTGADLAANAVGNAKIIDNQVLSADVRDDTLAEGGLKAQDLGAGSVGASEVANEGLTGEDIKNSSLNGGEISPATLGVREIIANSLTSAVIANDAVGYGELSSAAFNSEFADTGTAFGIADNSIQSHEVSDGSLTGADISESTLGPSLDVSYFNSPDNVAVAGSTADDPPLEDVAAKLLPAGQLLVSVEMQIDKFTWNPYAYVRCALRNGSTTLDRAESFMLAQAVQNRYESMSMTGVTGGPSTSVVTVKCGASNETHVPRGINVDSLDLYAIPVDSVG